MTHKSRVIIITAASQPDVDALSHNDKKKVEKIIKRANKKVAKLLGE